MPCRAAFLLLPALLCGTAPAQKALKANPTPDPDLRDLVVLAQGELPCRVLDPFAPDELEVSIKGRKQRIPRNRIQEMTLLRDLIREFLQRRRNQKPGDSAATWGWFLVEWAHGQQLYRLAELQAMDVALSHDLPEAHRYLRHREHEGTWLWPHAGLWYDHAGLEEAITSWGNGMILRSEHFELRLNGGIQMGIRALLDLEALYLWWGDAFGQDLQLREVLQPMKVHVHRSQEDFPRWGQPALPWFDPDPTGDIARTFVDDTGTRPERLFQVGSWQILWHALAGDPLVQSEDERVNPWLEMGLAGYAQLVFAGAPGEAQPREQVDPMTICLRAANLPIRLQTHVQLPIYAGYYLKDSRKTRQNWATATSLATWLLQESGPERRQGFLRYVRESLRGRKGTASTLWKRHLGVEVEVLEGPWRAWVRSVAGI